jgi:hypothetical protein
MKSSVKLRIISIFLVVLVLTSCWEEGTFSHIYILIDVTDEKLKTNYKSSLESSSAQILKTIGIKSDAEGYPGAGGGEVKVFTINDVSNSPSQSVPLEKGSGALSENEHLRQQKIKTFVAQLNKVFDGILKVNWEKKQSKIYQNICHGLNKISENPSDHKKVLVVYSDMIENSDLFSLYDAKEIENLTKNVGDLYEKKLKKECALPDLKGINIYVVTSRTFDNDGQISQAKRFWNELFRLKNGAAIFDSELNIQTLQQLPNSQVSSDSSTENSATSPPSKVSDEKPKSSSEQNRPPVFLANGTDLIQPQGTSGRGTLKVTNGTNYDAVVRLAEESSKNTRRLVYVRAKSKLKIEGIGECQCLLQFSLGRDWDKNTGKFLRDKSYSQFDDLLEFRETRTNAGIEWKTFEVTLHPVIDGNAQTTQIDESDFENNGGDV